MDTKKITVKEERKKLKRAARKKAAPKPKRTEPRGSRKPKVKKKGPGVAPRRKYLLKLSHFAEFELNRLSCIAARTSAKRVNTQTPNIVLQ